MNRATQTTQFPTTAIVLAGGQGTRLRPLVAHRPKPLAEVNGRPFLSYILDQLNKSRLTKLVLATGYMSQEIRDEYQDMYRGLRVTYSEEKTILGTGGAICRALQLIDQEEVFVLNGDSYCEVDLERFHDWHRQQGAQASIVLAKLNNSCRDRNRYGIVRKTNTHKIVEFAEKENCDDLPSLINAGIYLFNRNCFKFSEDQGKLSLEHDVLPNLVSLGLVYGYETYSPFLDIGTPDDYLAAGSFFASLTGTQSSS